VDNMENDEGLLRMVQGVASFRGIASGGTNDNIVIVELCFYYSAGNSEIDWYKLSPCA
jgi:hypothetical protein